MTIMRAHDREHAAFVADSAGRLVAWAVEQAFPLWADRGVDRAFGGFHEKLGMDLRPVDVARRARVQPRQVFAFAHAAALGWDGPADAVMRDGIASMFRRYARPDGLFRTLVGADGTVHEDGAVLYDQAFVLLALAGAHAVLGDPDAHGRAVVIRTAIEERYGHRSGGFLSGDASPLPLLANPHMHLLEACLDWTDRGGDARWGVIADRIATLALTRMIDPSTGSLGEAFDEDWRRVPGIAGRIVEPGHQFEWAWLLMRWAIPRGRQDAIDAALLLIGVGERGIDRARNVAVLELLDDMSVHASVGRLWAQTERIKAGCLAASITGDEDHLAVARSGCESVLAFLGDAPPGLWRDQMNEDGSFVEEPVPASTFYHVVVAIEALAGFVRSRSARS